jgi:TRAP-type C4-dicarboxylate transport system permease small subunit
MNPTNIHLKFGSKMMNILKKGVGLTNRLLFGLAGICLVLMMALACSNMVMRSLGHPIKGTFELMGFFGAMVAALSLVGTQASGGHIVITIFQKRFPKPVRIVLDMVTSVLSLVFFGLMAWQTWVLALGIREFEELSETLQIIYYPFILVVCLGVVALVVQIVLGTLILCTGNGEKS